METFCHIMHHIMYHSCIYSVPITKKYIGALQKFEIRKNSSQQIIITRLKYVVRFQQFSEYDRISYYADVQAMRSRCMGKHASSIMGISLNNRKKITEQLTLLNAYGIYDILFLKIISISLLIQLWEY